MIECILCPNPVETGSNACPDHLDANTQATATDERPIAHWLLLVGEDDYCYAVMCGCPVGADHDSD
jgi:hypothetical protein